MKKEAFVSPLVKLYIKKNAKLKNVTLPDDYVRILQDVTNCYKELNCKIAFLWLWNFWGRIPNASATIPGIIMINSEWAFQLVVNGGNEVVRDSFYMTVWHEMAHQKGDYFFLELFSNSSRFVNWVNEVHADYYAIEKSFDGSLKRGIPAMDHKLQMKNNKDKDSYTHPSRKRRKEFVEKYDFGEELIREIARITNCCDSSLIEKVSSFFEPISLARYTD